MRYVIPLLLVGSILAAINLSTGPLALLGWACLAVTAITTMAATITATYGKRPGRGATATNQPPRPADQPTRGGEQTMPHLAQAKPSPETSPHPAASAVTDSPAGTTKAL